MEVYEGVLTFIFFFVLLGLAFAADKYNESRNKEKDGEGDDLVEEDGRITIGYSALEIYRELFAEKKGEKAVDDE